MCKSLPHQLGYEGSPYAEGENGIKAHKRELYLLNKLFGVKGLPVFIIETVS